VASYVADLQASGTHLANSRRVTFEENGEDAVMDWTADSKTLILTRNRDSHYGIYKQPLGSNTWEPILAALSVTSNWY
jgi:hypothetical protein